MYYQLTQAEKKVARRVMDKGLEEHYRRALASTESVIKKWRDGKFENTTEAYLKLYQTVKKNDKHIGLLYNDKGGSRWVEVMALQLRDKVIAIEDLSELGEEARNLIISISNF